MDLRFVSSLIAVIDEGSLAAAARLIGVTPSAVAQRVSALEAQLQVPLLLRAGRVMQPTPECCLILPRLRQILREEAALMVDLKADRLDGPLRLGAISTVIGDYSAALVAGLRTKAPEVELQLVPGASHALYAAFEAEELDAVLIVRPAFELPKTMQFIPFAQQEIGWLTPNTQTQEALPYILYSREAWGGTQCWKALQAQDPAPRILAEMDALESIAQLVSDGLGRSVLPRWGALARFAPHAEFSAIQGLRRELGCLCWSRDSRRPVLSVLQDILITSSVDELRAGL